MFGAFDSEARPHYVHDCYLYTTVPYHSHSKYFIGVDQSFFEREEKRISVMECSSNINKHRVLIDWANMAIKHMFYKGRHDKK